MKRYAREDGLFRQGHAGTGRRRFQSQILALGLTALMTVTAVLEPVLPGFGGQSVQAAEVQSEISITSYITQGNTKKDVQITICTAEELRMFAQYVNEGNDTAGKTFSLKNDIILSTLTCRYDSRQQRTGIYRQDECIAAVDRNGTCYRTMTENQQTAAEECLDTAEIWQPVGDEEHPFQGCFLMNGHTVSGMMAVASEPIKGLFGVIDNGGNVSDGQVKESLVTGGTAAGAVAGINNGTVTECRSENAIVMSDGCVGGVIGTNTGLISQVTAENVTVEGKSSTMTTEREDMERVNGAGGIAGFHLSGTIKDCTLKGISCIVNGGGGIFGYMAGGSVEACSNYSRLDSLGANMGGIGGFIFCGTIVSCTNYGDINYTYQYDEHVNLGGIVAGSFSGSYRDITINGCINQGDVLQQEREGSKEGVTMDSVGGIIGRMGGGVLGNCGNEGKVGIITDKDDSEGAKLGGARGFLQVGGIAAGCDGPSMLRNCYNTGDIIGDIAYTGGIAGRKNFLELKACYTSGNISQKLGTGQITGFVDSGDMIDCYYLEGSNMTVYSQASDLSFEVSNCSAVSAENVESDLADRLNQCITAYKMDYFQKICPLRQWCQGEEKHPVFSAEYITLPTASPAPEVSETPSAGGTQGEAGGMPVVSETPSAADTPVPEAKAEAGASGDQQSSADHKASGNSTNKQKNAVLIKKTSLSLVESSRIAKVKKITVSTVKDGSLQITWKASAQNTCYGIYRQEGTKGKYKKLAVVTGKTTWLDKKTQKGKKYRYQIFACREQNNSLIRSGVTESRWIETAYFAAPRVSYKIENMDGKRYLKLTLQKYRGDHIDIVLQKNGKEQIIRLHPISKYQGVFRFSYTKTGKNMYCKVRTWEKRSGRKRFSAYTDMKKITL